MNEELKRLIRESGLTSEEAARKIGIGATHLSRLANHRDIRPQRTTLKMMETVLGPEVWDIFQDKAMRGPR